MKSITITDVEESLSFTFQNRRDLGGLINQIEGFEYPTTRLTVIDLPRGGALAIDSKFGRRICSFMYYITCDVLENRREFLQVMNQNGFLRLVQFTTLDDLELQFYAYIDKVRGSYTQMTKPIQIELVSPDWRFYSQLESSVTTGITTSSGGTALPTELPLSFAQTSGNPPVSITLNGDEDSPAVFRIQGPGTNFTVQNVTTGEVFHIDTTISSSEFITVDMLNRTVILGNNTNIYGLFSGTFWLLKPGENQISFTVGSGSSVDTELNIRYRDAYRGI